MSPEPGSSAATYTRVAAPAQGADAPGDVAVIAVHGMGQQIRFETVETIVRALVGNQGAGGHPIIDKVDTRYVQLGAEKLWRAELDLTRPDGGTQRVHVYEAYWAPLTEGQITLKETLFFLLRAGFDGLWYCTKEDFRRHLFGRWRTYPVNWFAAAQLLVLLLALGALVAINLAIATATSANVLSGGAAAWPTRTFLADLTVDLVIFETFAMITLGALGYTYYKQRPHRRTASPPPPPRGGSALLWALIGVTVTATIVSGAMVALHLVRDRTADVAMWWTWPHWLDALAHGAHASAGEIALLAAVWIAAVLVSYVLKLFLVEFAGDVAIYVASHRLDRFYETRQAIKDVALRTVQAVYQFGGYPQHVLVGHSLGSVVAYDTLNKLLNEDALVKGALNIRKRTRLLLTFGSPLDKTAFLFRAQSEFSDVREAMAAAAQPLITDYANRPPWLNIYSPNDPISGALDYYDPLPEDQDDTAKACHVVNLADPQAWIPLVAHTQYWTNDLFVSRLRQALTQTPASDAGGHRGGTSPER